MSDLPNALVRDIQWDPLQRTSFEIKSLEDATPSQSLMRRTVSEEVVWSDSGAWPPRQHLDSLVQSLGSVESSVAELEEDGTDEVPEQETSRKHRHDGGSLASTHDGSASPPMSRLPSCLKADIEGTVLDHESWICGSVVLSGTLDEYPVTLCDALRLALLETVEQITSEVVVVVWRTVGGRLDLSASSETKDVLTDSGSERLAIDPLTHEKFAFQVIVADSASTHAGVLFALQAEALMAGACTLLPALIDVLGDVQRLRLRMEISSRIGEVSATVLPRFCFSFAPLLFSTVAG